jgi:flagellar FliL protein
MQKFSFLKLFCSALLCVLCGLTPAAFANSGGGSASASAGGAATATLEPFTVNLSSFDRYLQISVTLQVAGPEVADKIKAVMPMVRHNMIMLLSGKESSQIQSADGKHDLIEEIKERINKVLETKEKNGVTDVFFVNFVIQ